MSRQQQVIGGGGADDLVSGRNQIRLEQIVVVVDAVCFRPRATGRPARTVGSHRVVAAAIATEGVHGADRNRGRLVSRRMNLSIDLLSGAALPVVTSGRHD